MIEMNRMEVRISIDLMPYLKNVSVQFFPKASDRFAGMDGLSDLKAGDSLLYQGQIDNMPGHGIFVKHDGRVLWGYHLHDFYILLDSVRVTEIPAQFGGTCLQMEDDHLVDLEPTFPESPDEEV